MGDKSFLEGQNKLINELKECELPFNLSNTVVKSPVFVGAVVSGERRIGKSSYMMQNLYYLYKKNWDKAFDHVFFDTKHFTDYLKEALDTGIRVPCVAIDDAGVNFGAQQWNVNRSGIVHITALLDTIGIIAKSIILTVPNSNNLIKAIREANFYHIELKLGQDLYTRRATGYLFHTTPKGQVYPTKEFIESFDVRLPEKITERYATLRKKYSVDTLADMDTFLNKNKPQQQETDADIATRLYSDYKAGLFGNMTYKDVCIAHKINYGYARNIAYQH